MRLPSSSRPFFRYARRGTALAAAVLALVTLGHAQGGEQRRTWRDHGGGPDNARYMTLTQITKENVGRLQVAWSYPSQDNAGTIFSPIVIDNMMFVVAKNNSLVALDAATGKEIWVRERMDGMARKGINYWESRDRSDRRLLIQMDSYLQALDARTGQIIPTFGNRGAVDLRDGLGRDPETLGRVQSSNPGKVFENLIILGSAPGEAYLSAPGDIRAFDVVTGKLAWQFHTVPHPGEFGYETWPKDAYKYVGGVNTWGEITVDDKRGIAFLPLGSPTFDYYGADRHGANLYGTSLLALDARTGKRMWHFQLVHHDLFDYDPTAAPQLTTIRHKGQLVDVVAQAGKTGFLYVFNRVTGEPIWPIEERPVPQSDVPGEASWPTQPFPTNPPAFAQQTLSLGDINPYVLTPEQRKTWAGRLAKARNTGLFTPPAVGIDTVSIPGAQGGANWGTTASNPTNGTVYVLSINVPSIYNLTLTEPASGRAGGAAPADPAQVARGQIVYSQRCAVCHAADRNGGGQYPSLIGVTTRLSPAMIRTAVTGGRPAMPAFTDLTDLDLNALVAFLGSNAPTVTANVVTPGVAGHDGSAEVVPARGGRGAGAANGVVVGSGGAPGAVPHGNTAGGGMVGPGYPAGVDAPASRYYTSYGMQMTLMRPPYSTITAYDLNTATIKWQVPAGGDYFAAVEQGGVNTGYPMARAGIVSTSTGVVFNAGRDSKLRAYDADTGRVLWVGDLPAGSWGVPAMYEVNGRQYLVINATGGGDRATAPPANPSAPPRAFVAFALR